MVDAVEAQLRAMGDLQDVVGLAGLAAVLGDADPWIAAVVPGGFDERSARQHRPLLVIDPERDDSPDCDSDGVSPSHDPRAVGRSQRCQSPHSSRCSANAVSVSPPRKHRSRATVGHHGPSAANREIRSASAALRAESPSTAAIASANASSVIGSSNA